MSNKWYEDDVEDDIDREYTILCADKNPCDACAAHGFTIEDCEDCTIWDDLDLCLNGENLGSKAIETRNMVPAAL